jgi:predicted DNA-binding transcriptional regulator AlpA
MRENKMDELDSVRVLSRPEAVKAVGGSIRTWERLEAAGDAPPKIRLSQGRVGYRLSDLKVWLESRREGVEAAR